MKRKNKKATNKPPITEKLTFGGAKKSIEDIAQQISQHKPIVSPEQVQRNQQRWKKWWKKHKRVVAEGERSIKTRLRLEQQKEKLTFRKTEEQAIKPKLKKEDL